MTEPSAIRRRRRKYRPAALRIQLLPRALARLISWHPLNAARAGAAVGLPVKDLVEGLSGNIYFVAGALIVTGFLLFASDRVKKGRKTERSAKLLDVLLVGIAQAIATCPGISRSGTTITAGCFVGFDRKFAVRFSFLLSIPAVLGANILTLKDAIQENSIIVSDIPVYLVGVAVAAVVGYICIRLLKMIADKGKFGWFAYYCWAVGLIVLALTLVLK